MSSCTPEQRAALMGKWTSRPNKLWLVLDWQHRGFNVQWKLSGSRLAFSFDGKQFKDAEDYEHELAAKLEDPRKKGSHA